MPNLAAGHFVEPIDPDGGAAMKHGEHFRQTRAFFRVLRRTADEMIMIRKHRPGFELPGEILRNLEKASLQNIKAIACPKVMCLEIRSCRHEIGAGFGQLMTRRVRPEKDRISHRIRVGRPLLENHSFPVAGLEKRQKTAALQDVAAIASAG